MRLRSGTRSGRCRPGYVPRDAAAELAGDEQAVSLWRAGEGLRVLIVPGDAWIGRPRR